MKTTLKKLLRDIGFGPATIVSYVKAKRSNYRGWDDKTPFAIKGVSFGPMTIDPSLAYACDRELERTVVAKIQQGGYKVIETNGYFAVYTLKDWQDQLDGKLNVRPDVVLHWHDFSTYSDLRGYTTHWLVAA